MPDQSYDEGNRPYRSWHSRIAAKTRSPVQRGWIAPGWQALQWQGGGCPLGHESHSAGRLLASTSEAIGKRRRAAPSAPSAAPEFMPKRNSEPLSMTIA